MILNISRGKFFQSCRQYAWNWDHERLMTYREADALITGGGYHIGSEIISKTADVVKAIEDTEKAMRERYAKSLILPEELPEIERQIEFAKHSVRLWADNYDKADFRVLWPEVSGCVALPGTEHHCWFCHQLLYPEIPFEECSGFYREDTPADVDPKMSGYAQLADFIINSKSERKPLPCHQPHYLRFRTDGVIEMYKHLWLLEQKTTSSTDRNSFWEKFQLDMQVRGYCYGIWKSTGVLVNGVLVNAIIKHHKQVTVDGRKKYILDPTNIGFEREPVLITKADLEDFERDFVKLCNDYEHAFRTKNIYKNTQSCFSYNRKCYYWDLCKRGYAVDGEFKPRDDDYVNEEYYNLLKLPKPQPLVKEITNAETTKQTESSQDRQTLPQS